MKKVEALRRLAGGNPRGCDVGIYIEWSRGNCCGSVCRFEITIDRDTTSEKWIEKLMYRGREVARRKGNTDGYNE